MTRSKVALAFALALLAFVPASAGAAIPSVLGGDVSCAVQGDGARFCGGTLTTSKTFDGVPIDINAAFPPEPAAGADGNYPLVMLFHGYAGSKLGLSSMRRWLSRGYATFSMTTRGFNGSCGNDASRMADPAGCAAGYVRLMDTRFEVRDAQEFAARLADEGLINPKAIGAVGGSYGGGLSMALAALKDRKMLPDGSLTSWVSAGGKAMEIAAAVPGIPWTDLSYSLVPNGGTLDYVADAPYRGRTGVKKSFVDGLYLSGQGAGEYAAPGSDPDADLTGWYDRLNAGEPYDNDPFVEDLLQEITSHHSSYYIDDSQAPAPLLITNGWTDDLFPADEAIRFYNRTTTKYPSTPISLFFLDYGHMRGQNKAADLALRQTAEEEWIDFYVKGAGSEPFQGVTTLTQTCPQEAASAGPYFARSWAGIAPGEVRLRNSSKRTVEPDAGDSAIGVRFDPLFGGGACAQTSADTLPGTATYSLAAPAGGMTLMGSPTVIADITTPGSTSQLAARLLDVGPDGQQTLVARGLWRPVVGAASRRQAFQLHPNGWNFAEGHRAKLELLPNDAPYGRTSDGQEAITVDNLELRLPVTQKPGSGKGLVRAAAPKVLPNGYRLARDFKLRPKPRARLAKGRLNVTGKRIPVRVTCPASFQSCHKVAVRIIGAPKKGKGRGTVIARGTLGKIAGGKSKRRAITLTRAGRRLLGVRRGMRVRVITASAETEYDAVQLRSARR